MEQCFQHAGLTHIPQAQTNSALLIPQHRPVAQQQSINEDYSEILELTNICHQNSNRPEANLVSTQSDGEYVVPNWSDEGCVVSDTHYQQLKADNQEYLTLYTTPDMQKPNMLDVDGHPYKLLDVTSMDSPGVYADLKS